MTPLSLSYTSRPELSSYSETAPSFSRHANCDQWPIRVLIVDDDPAIRIFLTSYLARHNIHSSGIKVQSNTANVFSRSRIDIAVVGLNFGRDDGLKRIRDIRSHTELPIIVLTADHRDEFDRILALETGADDYLTKPVNPRELLARIRAILRRSRGRINGPAEGGSLLRYRFSRWELDLCTRSLAAADGAIVPLTKGEFALLTILLASPRRVLSRDYLLAASRVHDEDVFDRAIDVLIFRLRRKIERAPSQPELIKTERGVGYIFVEHVEIIK